VDGFRIAEKPTTGPNGVHHCPKRLFTIPRRTKVWDWSLFSLTVYTVSKKI